MIELILLIGLAWMLRNWLRTPTEQDMCDWIVVNELNSNEMEEGEL